MARIFNMTGGGAGGTGPAAPDHLQIKRPPQKLDYLEGDTFQPEGMELLIWYTDGTSYDAIGYTFEPSGPLRPADDHVTISYRERGVTLTIDQSIRVKADEKKVYGAVWDGSAATKWTRTDAAAEFGDPVPAISNGAGSSPFDDIMPWSGMVRETRDCGEMVKIPKFWYKLEQRGNGLSIQIANARAEGFSVSPAHMDRGDGRGERDAVYLSRYHCGPDYRSATAQIPGNDHRRERFRLNIHALGENVWQMDFAMWFTIWLLYIVEFADWNIRAAIGRGGGNGSEPEVMGYTDEMQYHTGTALASRDTYGVGTQYRYLEGLWENVRDWVDGCYNSDAGLNIILDPNHFSDSAGGEPVGVPSDGYPSVFTVSGAGGFPMFYPTAAEGSEETYSCDPWEYDATNPCLCVGGYYRQDRLRGLFCINYRTSDESSGGIGGRIMELP